MDGFLPVLICLGAVMLYALRDRMGERLMLAASVEGDEDIKIATGHFSQAHSSEDAAELAAQDFLRQKELGNIQLARELGTRYAQGVLNREEGPLKGQLEGKSPQIQHQIYLLYSYAVTRVIADHSPNSILAQTSLNQFYSEIEGLEPELHKQLSDMAGFSLYILCERSRNRSDAEIGWIFAQLCGRAKDQEMASYGNRLYDRFYDACVEEIRTIAYVDA